MEKKQSSVEWLAEQLTEYSLDKWEIKVIVQRALQMHKEEIAKSYFEGENRKWNSVNGYEYYNETFGGDNE